MPDTTRSQCASFFLGKEGGGRTRTVSTFTINRNNFLCLFSLLTGRLVIRRSSYSSNWVNSWPINWKNQFPTCVGGLTDGFL